MKKLALIVLLAILFVSSVAASQDNSFKVIDTADTLEDAQQKAASENKSVFVVFESNTCSYCEMLRENTLNNGDVMDKLNEGYVTVMVNINEQPDIASEYNVVATPVMLVLDENGDEKQRITGYMEPQDLISELDEE